MGGLVGGLHMGSTWFRTKVGLSGKVALVVSGVFFNFVLVGEQELARRRRLDNRRGLSSTGDHSKQARLNNSSIFEGKDQ